MYIRIFFNTMKFLWFQMCFKFRALCIGLHTWKSQIIKTVCKGWLKIFLWPCEVWSALITFLVFVSGVSRALPPHSGGTPRAVRAKIICWYIFLVKKDRTRISVKYALKRQIINVHVNVDELFVLDLERISKGKWTFFCLDSKGLVRGCWPATARSEAGLLTPLWCACNSMYLLQRFSSFSAIPNVTSVNFSAGQLGCTGKDEHFYTPFVLYGFALLLRLMWRSTEGKIKLAALGFVLFLGFLCGGFFFFFTF